MKIMTDFLALLAWVALCFGVALAGSITTFSSVNDWYPTLAKPSWTPPNWLFGPVWTALFFMMAVAAWWVWRKAGWTRGHTFFVAQLLLNGLWSWLFFGQQRPDLALVDILLLLPMIIATQVEFARHSRLAAYLLLPYAAWVAFATVLNASIWSLNQ